MANKLPEYRPKPGYEWNPLKRHRNFPCPCGSGKKIKRCHGQSQVLCAEEADAVRDYLTKLANYGFIKRRAREQSNGGT